MAAGLATISLLDGKTYSSLEQSGSALEEGLSKAAERASIAVTINRVGSMLGLFFCDGDVKDFATANATDRKRYARFHHEMLNAGVYLPPSPLETTFTSTAHTGADIRLTVAAAAQAFREMGAP
jgi:glutamate-1-semialdehyde 2,1-aminomutase